MGDCCRRAPRIRGNPIRTEAILPARPAIGLEGVESIQADQPIRTDISSIKTSLADHGRQLIEVRRQLNAMQAEIIRADEHMLGLDARLDRIERRLELTDAD